MLRAYFSRVCNELPPAEELGPDFDVIDRAKSDRQKTQGSPIVGTKRLLAQNGARHDRQKHRCRCGKTDLRAAKAKDLAGHRLRHAGEMRVADPRLFPDALWGQPEADLKAEGGREYRAGFE